VFEKKKSEGQHARRPSAHPRKANALRLAQPRGQLQIVGWWNLMFPMGLLPEPLSMGSKGRSGGQLNYG
jgi:hypothetical protein